MGTKHTQGEWFINPRSSRNVRCGSKTIANCSQGQNGENEEEEIANAKLIAAAPELLDALQYLVHELTGEQECEDELEKGLGAHLLNKVLAAKYAIKKAKVE